jgi:hypothetical protein
MPEKTPRTRKRAAAPKTPPAAPPTTYAAAPTTRPAASLTPAAPRAAVSAEERRRMISEAAYFRAQRRGFRGDPVRDWAEAEAEIDAMLLDRR